VLEPPAVELGGAEETCTHTQCRMQGPWPAVWAQAWVAEPRILAAHATVQQLLAACDLPHRQAVCLLAVTLLLEWMGAAWLAMEVEGGKWGATARTAVGHSTRWALMDPLRAAYQAIRVRPHAA
jgi:ferric-dicitrate binding protein FerR (iron transport regulator)